MAKDRTKRIRKRMILIINILQDTIKDSNYVSTVIVILLFSLENIILKIFDKYRFLIKDYVYFTYI